ncbi:MAG: MBL fold metallo-hydrolase [Solirubrobacterales bacterium]|nr:MBL fold metallo-hydrolase [Solirubrobacterales bacterium]MBV9714205.1 MBL fold metallo-hydrolase [Solirubrobacterales bacterium]
MRVLALHRDVIVFISRVWQTTCTAVRAGGEGFVIDSPVYPDELEALPGVLAQAAYEVSGLLNTHADWDHLLARLAFPDAALGCSEAAAARLAAEPGDAQRRLRRFDEDHYVAGRPALGLSAPQALPVPGKLSLGDEHELELHLAPGHTSDGMAILIPWTGVLVAGDYLSPVEIPMISESGSVAAYRSTLAHLRGLLDRAETVVPGHGAPVGRARALEILAEDLAYLEALPDAELPPGRRTAAQQRIHAENLSRAAR